MHEGIQSKSTHHLSDAEAVFEIMEWNIVVVLIDLEKEIL